MLLLYNSSYRRMIVKDLTQVVWIIFPKMLIKLTCLNILKKSQSIIVLSHQCIWLFLKCMDYTITARLHILYIKATIWLYVHAEIIYEIRMEWLQCYFYDECNLLWIVQEIARDQTEACNCLHLSWRGVTWEKYRPYHLQLQPHTNILITHLLIQEWKIYSLHMPHLWVIKVRITGNYIQCLNCTLVCYGFAPSENPPLPLLPLHFWISVVY